MGVEGVAFNGAVSASLSIDFTVAVAVTTAVDAAGRRGDDGGKASPLSLSSARTLGVGNGLVVKTEVAPGVDNAVAALGKL
jgi:hypothetical protein